MGKWGIIGKCVGKESLINRIKTNIMELNEAEIIKKIQNYSWYHTIELTSSIWTPGIDAFLPIQEVPLQVLRMLELQDGKVLDIGCRDGLFSFEAEKLGAKEVIGIDNDLSKGAVEFLIPYFKSRVKMYELNLFDLKPETFGTFDLVIFCGVLYHLRYPFWGLKVIRDILNPGGTIIIETGVMLNRNDLPLLFCPIEDESPYEPTSCTFFNLKGLTDTLASMGLKTEHIELLRNYSKEEWKEKHNNDINKFAGSVAIDRATLICTFKPEIIDEKVSAYWDKTHKMHANYKG